MRSFGIMAAGLAFAASSVACGNSGGAHDAGVGDGGAPCGMFAACGGDVVGTWTVESLCLDNVNALVTAASADPKCAGAVKRTDVKIAGTYVYDRSGTATINVTQRIVFDTLWPVACYGDLSSAKCSDVAAMFIATGSFFRVSCEAQSGGCACLVPTAENAVMSSGGYRVSGKNLLQEGTESPYCVQNDTLTIRRTSAGATGILVLKRM